LRSAELGTLADSLPICIARKFPWQGTFLFATTIDIPQQTCAIWKGTAREAGADALLCTEKDLFNLDDVAMPSIPLCFCAMEFEMNDAAGYWEAIESTLARRRPGNHQT
jgi:hypothetical protein